mmetsp:Transcript_140141/g.254871  ORF Transcript_140141/g.254871 Transcript_140141/m.254871 type:complete len:277 (+) Transcript_140141:57-887(+)
MSATCPGVCIADAATMPACCEEIAAPSSNAGTGVMVTVQNLAGDIVLGPEELNPGSTVKAVLQRLTDGDRTAGFHTLVHGTQQLHDEELLADLTNNGRLQLTLVLNAVPLGASMFGQLAVWTRKMEDERNGKQQAASDAQELFGQHLGTGQVFMFYAKLGCGNSIYLRLGSKVLIYRSDSAGYITLQQGTCHQGESLRWKAERPIFWQELRAFMADILAAAGRISQGAEFDIGIWTTFLRDLGVQGAIMLRTICLTSVRGIGRLNESDLLRRINRE